MKRGEEFVGFKEGPIDFPPTFKYDVLRTTKQTMILKSNSSKHTLVLPDVEERTDMVEDESEQEGGDSCSILSSVWTSNLSRMTSRSSFSSSESGKEKEMEMETEKEKETDTAAVNAQFNINEANEGVSGILQAAHRAKIKWLSRIHSSKESNETPTSSSARALITRSKSLTHQSPVKRNRRPSTLAGSKAPVVEKLSTRLAVTSTVSSPAGGDAEPASASSLTTEIVKGSSEVVTKIARNINRSSVTRRGHHNRDMRNMEELSTGIYDSSSKRRVPSWCVVRPTIIVDPV